MTGLKLALSFFGIISGFSSWLGGTIIANTSDISAGGSQVITNATPVTLALTMGGITTAAICAWKASRIWSKAENAIENLQREVRELKEKRSDGETE